MASRKPARKPPAAPPVAQPTPADYFWRASLAMITREGLTREVTQTAESGNVWRFQILLQMPVNWVAQESALQAAAGRGDVWMFHEIQKRADIDIEYEADFYLTVAVMGGHLALYKMLIEDYGLSVNQNDALAAQLAITAGRADFIAYMLKKGLDPDTDDGELFVLAAARGRIDIMKQLSASGDFKNVAERALVAAIENDQMDMVAWLVGKGVKNNISAGDLLLMLAGQESVERLDRLAAGYHFRAEQLDEALQRAVSLKHAAVARRLIAMGADINAGGTCVASAIDDGDIAALTLALDLGADPNRMNVAETPLMAAAARLDRDMIDLLLARGADPAAQAGAAISNARQQEGGREIALLLIDHIRRRRAAGRLAKRTEFEAAFPAGYTLEDLRQRTGPSGDTGLLLAAQSGVFAALVAPALAADRCLTLDDLLHPPQGATSVAGFLIRDKALAAFFDDSLWPPRHYRERAQLAQSLPPAWHRRAGLERLRNAYRMQQMRNRPRPKGPAS